MIWFFCQNATKVEFIPLPIFVRYGKPQQKELFLDSQQLHVPECLMPLATVQEKIKKQKKNHYVNKFSKRRGIKCDYINIAILEINS